MTPKPLDAFPELMTVAQLGEWRGISSKRAYALHAEGAFEFALIKPSTGRILYDRERLRAWKDGTLRGLTGLRKIAS